MGAVAAKPFADLRADFPVLAREINGHPLSVDLPPEHREVGAQVDQGLVGDRAH